MGVLDSFARIMLNEHERLLIENFVAKDKRERLRFLMSEPSRRKRLRAKFSSTFVLLEERRKSIPGSDQSPAGIYQLLRNSGAPEDCYTISENDEIDGQNTNLRETLERLVGAGFETIVSCVPGKLAYFEGEQERYILHHPRSPSWLHEVIRIVVGMERPQPDLSSRLREISNLL